MILPLSWGIQWYSNQSAWYRSLNQLTYCLVNRAIRSEYRDQEYLPYRDQEHRDQESIERVYLQQSQDG